MDSTRLPRRRVLQIGAAGLAVGSLPARAGQPEPPAAKRGRGVAKNAIFLVSDGMSAGTFTLAEMMREVRGMGPSHWSRFWMIDGVRRALCTTHAADGWVTDSAAAGSAWGVGRKVNNRAINITPDGEQHEPILSTARAMGKATGLVTTTRLTHATPASFIANVPRRDLEDIIAEQMIDRGVDLLLGGGAKHFPAPLLDARSDLTVVRDRAALLSRAGVPGRLLGLFAEDHIPYAIEREATVPSLPEMASVAIDRLSASADGFVLQIEAGRVDHAAHNNDAAAMIADQIEFDETIRSVAAWVSQRDDTLLIITTDHGNANPGLTYYGDRGVASFERLAGVRRSFEWITAEAARRDRGFEGMLEAVHEAVGVTLSDDEVELLRRAAVDNAPVNAFDIANGTMPVLGSVLANHFGVAFLSPNHTADHVEVTAFGPGSERMPVWIDNTDLYHMTMAALEPDRPRPWSSATARSLTPWR